MKLMLKVFITLLIVNAANAQPVMHFSPDPLRFGYISEGGEQHRRLVISNTGNATLVLDSCRVNAPFAIGTVNGLSIEPSAAETVMVDFYPQEINSYDLDITFYSNAQPPQYDLRVYGNGTRVFTPGEMIWSFQHIENVVCVLAAGDYNGDGITDVVAEGYDSGAQGNPLVCLSGSGEADPEVIWSVHPPGGPSNSGGYGDQCLALTADVNGDNHPDVLRGTAWGGRTVYAIDGMTGDVIWSYDTYINEPSGWIYSVNPINDVNGDGVPDALAGIGSDGDRIVCLDGADGTVIWYYNGDDAVSSVAALPDIDEDGVDEAIFSVMDSGDFFYCISGASSGYGTPLWMFNTGYSTWSVCPIKDINDDGYDDAIAGTWGRGVMAFSGHRFGQGVILWEYPLNTNVMKVVESEDLDSDGISDVLVASWSSYAIALSGVDGSEIWRYYSGDDVWAIDRIDDVTGDGVDDAIAGSFTHEVHLIDGARGVNVWTFQAGAKPFSVRSIDDVNGDGYKDVIVGTQLLNGEGGQVFVVSGGEVRTSIDEPGKELPDSYFIVKNYPNPFNSITEISFNLQRESTYEISIFDISGRLVDSLKGVGHSGRNFVNWDAGKKQTASGVYFYKIVAGGSSGFGKMTFLK